MIWNGENDGTFAETLLFKEQRQRSYDSPLRGYLDGASVVLNHADKQAPPRTRAPRPATHGSQGV